MRSTITLSASTLDVLWVLYDQILGVSPNRVSDPSRDRFLLSKGHGPSAYYAVLAELDDGSNAEAIEFAAASRLGSLTVMAIDNASATWG